jgi:hypothetical protein
MSVYRPRLVVLSRVMLTRCAQLMLVTRGFASAATVAVASACRLQAAAWNGRKCSQPGLTLLSAVSVSTSKRLECGRTYDRPG